MTPRQDIQHSTRVVLGTPAVHMLKDPAAGRKAGPLCGQQSMSGGWARTGYTDNALHVTCRKCTAALKKAGGA